MTRAEAVAAAAGKAPVSIVRTNAAAPAGSADIAAVSAAMAGLAGAIDAMRTALETIGDLSGPTATLDRLHERSREGATDVARIAQALAACVDGSRCSSEQTGEWGLATDEIAGFIEEAARTSRLISASLRQLRETVGRNESAAGVLKDNARALEEVGFQLQRVMASLLHGAKAA